jgi:hypothetical protein
LISKNNLTREASFYLSSEVGTLQRNPKEREKPVCLVYAFWKPLEPSDYIYRHLREFNCKYQSTHFFQIKTVLADGKQRVEYLSNIRRVGQSSRWSRHFSIMYISIYKDSREKFNNYTLNTNYAIQSYTMGHRTLALL